MSKEKVLPQEEGFYWARQKGFQYWNLMVWVYGDSPFFNLAVWFLDVPHEAADEVSHLTIHEFGPRIEDAPALDSRREDWG